MLVFTDVMLGIHKVVVVQMFVFPQGPGVNVSNFTKPPLLLPHPDGEIRGENKKKCQMHPLKS